MRSSLGCQTLGWEYGQMGLVATLHLAASSINTTAFQRFLPTGPVGKLRRVVHVLASFFLGQQIAGAALSSQIWQPSQGKICRQDNCKILLKISG